MTDISALSWGHSIKSLRRSVFDGRRGDRLRLTLSENDKGHTNNVVAQGCDSPSWGKQSRQTPPLGMRRPLPFLLKETQERKSYAIDRPFRNDFKSIGLSLLFSHFV